MAVIKYQTPGEGQIEAMTGATVTSTAVTNAVNQAIAQYYHRERGRVSWHRRSTGLCSRSSPRASSRRTRCCGWCWAAAPRLAVTTAASNAIGMGAATTFVLVCSNGVISLLRKVIPDKVRIPSLYHHCGGVCHHCAAVYPGLLPRVGRGPGGVTCP